MCNPKPGIRCTSHSGEAYIKAQAAYRQSLATVEPTEEGRLAVEVAKTKAESARTEYMIALANSNRAEHRQQFEEFYRSYAEELGMRDDQVNDFININRDRYQGIAQTRKDTALEIEEGIKNSPEENENTQLQNKTPEELAQIKESTKRLNDSNLEKLIRRINDEADPQFFKSAAVLLGRRLKEVEDEEKRRVETGDSGPYPEYADAPVDDYGLIAAKVLNSRFDNPDENIGVRFEVKKGRRYDKIMRRTRRGAEIGGGSVYLFNDKQNGGAILKPAGMNAPAAGVRRQPTSGSDIARICNEEADQYGSWLYAR